MLYRVEERTANGWQEILTTPDWIEAEDTCDDHEFVTGKECRIVDICETAHGTEYRSWGDADSVACEIAAAEKRGMVDCDFVTYDKPIGYSAADVLKMFLSEKRH